MKESKRDTTDPADFLQIVRVDFGDVPVQEVHILLPGVDTGTRKHTEAVFLHTIDSHGDEHSYTILSQGLSNKLRTWWKKLEGREIEKATPRFDLSSNLKVREFIELNLTPYEALLLLTRNWMNREVDANALEVYIDQLQSEQWIVTNQGIGLDWFGAVTDAQHRLLACLFAGKRMPTFIVKGLDPASRKKNDIGVIRKPAEELDMFGEDGLPKGNQIVGAVTTIFKVHEGRANRIKTADAITRLRDHYTEPLKWLCPVLSSKSDVPDNTRALFRLMGTRAAFLIMRLTYPEKADELLQRLLTGNLSDNTTARTIYTYLGRQHTPDDYMSVVHRLLYGFAAYLDGESVDRLQNIHENPGPKDRASTTAFERRCWGMVELLQRFWKEQPLLPEFAIERLPDAWPPSWMRGREPTTKSRKPAKDARKGSRT